MIFLFFKLLTVDIVSGHKSLNSKIHGTLLTFDKNQAAQVVKNCGEVATMISYF